MDCEGNINLFCFICGKVTLSKKRYWSDKVEDIYKLCFDCEVTENISPDDICKTCCWRLMEFKRNARPMPFKEPMKWLADEHDNENCYACANKKAKYVKQKDRHMFQYVAVPSIEMPIYDVDDMPQSPVPSTSSSAPDIMPQSPVPSTSSSVPEIMPQPQALSLTSSEEEDIESCPGMDLAVTPDASPNINQPIDTDIASEAHPGSSVVSSEMKQVSSIGWQPPQRSLPKDTTPVLISQKRLDKMLAKSRLSKKQSETMARFLKTDNLLERGVKITAYRKRHLPYQACFKVVGNNSFVYCPNIKKLMSTMGIKYNTMDWYLFIDGSSSSLKAVLIHRTTDKPSIPVAYSAKMKESYENIEIILKAIKYKEHYWKICCDFKVMAFLCGLKGGYAKYMCYKCLWDSRYNARSQYQKTDWPPRKADGKIGDHSQEKKPLVSFDKLLLPPLHLKLGIVKNFIKQVVKKEPVFQCLTEIFPKLTPAKIKEGVYQIQYVYL